MAAKKAVARKASAKKAATKKASAKKTVAKKASARKKAAAKKASAKKTVAKKASAKKAATKKASAKKTVAKKASARKTAAKKASAKKTVAKRASAEKDGGQEGATEAVVPTRDSHLATTPIDWVAAGWVRFDYYTEKASEIARKLALLGFPTIIFVTGISTEDFAVGDVVDVPDRLILAGVLLGLSLVLDMLHHILGSLVWFAWPRFHEYHEGKPGYKPPDGYPGWLPVFSNVMFAAKVVSAAAGWLVLLVEIAASVK